MIDFITGEKFVGIADVIFVPPINRNDDYLGIKSNFYLHTVLPHDPCIVYTHTFYVNELFDTIRDINHKFIVITHNCDWNVDGRFKIPDNVIRWYTQNVNILNDKICAIPIGLQNSSWNKYGNKYKIIEDKIKESQSHRGLIYVNFATATNPGARTHCFDLFKNKPWATISSHTQNFDRFEDYVDNVYNHKFVVCPEGNGLDTHRFWEALYLNSIPIVLRSVLTDALYSYFPVTIVDKWEDVTEELLNREFDEISDIKERFSGASEMLDFGYWKEKILNQ